MNTSLMHTVPRGVLRSCLGVLLCTALGVKAETFMVTSLHDAGPGTLREAVERANGNPGEDTIRFALDGTVQLKSPLLIKDDLRLDGMGQRVQLNGGGTVTLLVLTEPHKRLEVARLTLSQGLASASTGGAILARGHLIVHESLFTGNVAPVGGAIYSTGASLEVSNSTFADNQALSWGGAIAVSPTTLALITHSTFVNNTAAQFGGALFQNPIYPEPGAGSPAKIATRSAVAAAGAGATSAAANGAVQVRNSILSGVSAQGNCSVISNRIIDGGGNLSSDTSCPFSADKGSASGLNPRLGPLADHGGPTHSFMPLPGSPAVDAGVDVLATASNGSGLGTDQRGQRRVTGLRVDRGAVELQAADRLALPVSAPGQALARLGAGPSPEPIAALPLAEPAAGKPSAPPTVDAAGAPQKKPVRRKQPSERPAATATATAYQPEGPERPKP
jgi:predicted outer membrane repeat protein